MKTHGILTACFAFLLAGSAHAQTNGLTFEVNFRTRGEVRKGGLDVNRDNAKNYANFIHERTLFGAQFERSWLTAKLTAQHSSIWGDDASGAINIYEAWTQLSSPKGFFAKIGRQNLSYDNQRVFGADDWAMTARSHDVLKIGYEGHGHKLHLFAAYNQSSANVDGGTYFDGGLQPYKSMQAAWYHLDVPHTNIGLSLIAMNVGMQGGERNQPTEHTFQQHLYGGYLSFRPRFGLAEAEYYRQGGHEEHGVPIDAWMASGKVTLTPGSGWSLYGGYDYLSGDDDYTVPKPGQAGMMHHERIRGFTSIYGSHHKFYGAMDFFYVKAYFGGFSPGLQNAYVGGTWKPLEKLSLDVSAHYLAMAANLEEVEKTLGYEFESALTWSLNKDVDLSAGYSYMHGTESMVYLKRSDENRKLRWAWIMLSITPSFLQK